MGVAYETNVSIVKPTSGAVITAVPFISRGFITKLIAVLETKNADFTIDVFNQNPAVPGFGTGNPENIYKVLPSLSSTGSSGLIEFFGSATAQLPAAFQSMDGMDAAGKLPATLWVRLSGAATGTIHVAIAGIKTRP